jgi:hypothetical protein
MRSQKTPDKKTGLNESFYVENTSTGRFRPSPAENDRGKRVHTNTLTHQNLGTARNETDGGLNVVMPVMINAAFVCFLFLQGILSGLSLSALYEALTSQRPSDFFAKYSATRANEIRRYFFIGITFCTTGSLCMLNKDDASRVLESLKGGDSKSSITKTSISLCYFILVYFVALTITVVCSHADVSISDIATNATVLNFHTSTENIESVLHSWKGLSVSRSVLCIIGWLISCYNFVLNRGNIRLGEGQPMTHSPSTRS